MAHTRVLERFAPADVDSIHVLADAVEQETGSVPFGEVTWDSLAGRGSTADRGLFVGGDDGEARAYAHVVRHHPSEWSIEIAARRADEGALSSLVAAARDEIAAAGGGHATLWIHGDRAPLDAIPSQFQPERELLELRVPLPLPDPPKWPDGVHVRAFVVGRDEADWIEVNNRAFVGHPEQGAWTLDTIQQREQADWFDPDGFLLAFDDDGLAGFCWTKVHPAAPPREPVALGEIYVIGADPSRQGRGLGRALTTAGLESLAGRGITFGMLYVDGANTAAVVLYYSLGFVTHRVDRAYGADIAPSPRRA
jgi:mycothiol synthase